MLRDVDSSGWPDEEVLIPCISGAAGWTYVCCVVVCVCVCVWEGAEVVGSSGRPSQSSAGLIDLDRLLIC